VEEQELSEGKGGKANLGILNENGLSSTRFTLTSKSPTGENGAEFLG